MPKFDARAQEDLYFGISELDPEQDIAVTVYINGVTLPAATVPYESDPAIDRIVGELGLNPAELVAGTAKIVRIRVAGELNSNPDSADIVLNNGLYPVDLLVAIGDLLFVQQSGTLQVS
jgi:hypothetical protein